MRTFGTSILVLTIFALTFFASIIGTLLYAPIAVADTEPNDDFDHAELITPGDYEGTFFDPENDRHDFYRVTNIKPGQKISLKCVFDGNGEAVFSIALLDEERVIIVGDTMVLIGQQTTLSWTTSSAKSSYTYYIEVSLGTYFRAYGAEPRASYSLKVSIIDHYDANSGTDAGDSFESALSVVPGDYESHLSSTVGGDDVEDYYRINQTLDAGQLINVKVTPATNLAVKVYVYDPNRAQISYRYSANLGAIVRINATAPQSGIYYIEVKQGAVTIYGGLPVAGDYSMEISIASNQSPAAVTLSTPTYATYESVRLDWTKSEEPDFDRYEIFQSTSSGSLGTLIHTVIDRTTTYYTVAGLSAETTYYFTVRVVDIGDLNTDSNKVEAKTKATFGEEEKPPPALWLSPEVIIGIGVGGTGLTAAIALIIQVWRTGKGVLEILRDIKGLFTWKKGRKKKKEENHKT